MQGRYAPRTTRGGRPRPLDSTKEAAASGSSRSAAAIHVWAPNRLTRSLASLLLPLQQLVLADNSLHGPSCPKSSTRGLRVGSSLRRDGSYPQLGFCCVQMQKASTKGFAFSQAERLDRRRVAEPPDECCVGVCREVESVRSALRRTRVSSRRSVEGCQILAVSSLIVGATGR